MTPTFFISDLHLDGLRPDITDQFLKFLRTDATQASALYILGDLFEVWIGDDDPDPDKRRIQDAIRELTNKGIACFVLHGNRDFLLGKRFCDATGCRLIHDGEIVAINGRRIALLHGDTLCVDDHAYQRLRRVVRNPIVKFIFRCMSPKQRQTLAQKLRAGSKAHIENSMETIMDVNANAVKEAFQRYNVDLIIHGHTHRPAVHTYDEDGHVNTRIVLGDWYTQGSVLRWDESGYKLKVIARDASG